MAHFRRTPSGKLVGVCALTGSLGIAAGAGAQEATGGLEEVTVTATRQIETVDRVRALVPQLQGAGLTLTTLTGSALLAVAHARGRLDAEAAWAAAHVDEDWQIGKWGEDAEASDRRARRWAEMQAASRLLALLA